MDTVLVGCTGVVDNFRVNVETVSVETSALLDDTEPGTEDDDCVKDTETKLDAVILFEKTVALSEIVTAAEDVVDAIEVGEGIKGNVARELDGTVNVGEGNNVELGEIESALVVGLKAGKLGTVDVDDAVSVATIFKVERFANEEGITDVPIEVDNAVADNATDVVGETAETLVGLILLLDALLTDGRAEFDDESAEQIETVTINIHVNIVFPQEIPLNHVILRITLTEVINK